MKTKTLVFLAMLLVVSLIVVGCGTSNNQESAKQAQDSAKQTQDSAKPAEDKSKPKFLSVGTAGTGGAFYPIGIAIADIITNQLGIQTTAQVTGGSVENITLVDKKNVELAISKPDLAYKGKMGVEPYKEKHENVRVLLAGLSRGVFHVVVNEKSKINSIKDLKGKKVVMGPPGGGATETAPDVLAAFNLTLDDIKPVYVSYDQGVSQLTDGQVDAIFVQSAAPAPAIMELVASKKPIRLLSIEEQVFTDLLNKCPYYIRIDLPRETYNTSEPIITIGNTTMVIVNKDLSDELVYVITRAIWDNVEKIKKAHPSAKEMTLENAVKGHVIPLHPGAEKYYKERGLL